MKKNGFVSVTMIYAFCFLFLAVVLSTVIAFASKAVLQKREEQDFRKSIQSEITPKYKKEEPIIINDPEPEEPDPGDDPGAGDNPTPDPTPQPDPTFVNDCQQINSIISDCSSSDSLACKIMSRYVNNDVSSSIILHNGTFKDSSDNVLDADDCSFRFTGGNYELTIKATNAGYITPTTYSSNTNKAVISLKCKHYDEGYSWDNVYIGDYDGGCKEYRHYYLSYNNNQYDTFSEAVARAITDGYLVARNIDNYVCFTAGTTCSEDNLFRIIGIFDDDQDGNYEVKLIKDDYATTSHTGSRGYDVTNFTFKSLMYTGYTGSIEKIPGYCWSGTEDKNVKTWEESQLRSYNLNSVYKTKLDGRTNRTELIKDNDWYIGYLDSSAGTKPKNILDKEKTATLSGDKIALMNISDYLFSYNSTYWNKTSFAEHDTWLYNGIDEWTISYSRNPDTAVASVRKVLYGGNVTSSMPKYGMAIRPVFYLNSSVKWVKGTGTKTDPYFITAG